MAAVGYMGYACEFVDTPKDLQTECSVCLHVLRDPHMVDCCGYRFCKGCIERVLADFNSCPLCNHRQPKAVADKQLSRTLREKRVRCTHKGEGCKWIGQLSALDEHLDVTKRVDGCRYRNIHCSYCSSLFRFDQLANHELICPRKPVICEYCNVFQCLRYELHQHYENCTLYPIICPKGCGAKITRAGLDKHFRNWCPLGIIDCEFSYAGCKVTLHRKCMKHHLDEDVKDHLDLMKKKFSAMKVAYEEQRDKSEQLENELDEAMEELGEAQGESAETKEELEEVREELEEVKQELEDKKAQLQRNSTREDVTLVKKLCFLRQEGQFDWAKDQVLVSNLPPQTTEQMLKSLFGQHGPIYAVKLYSDFDIGVVEFQNTDSVPAMFRKYHSSGIRLRGYQLKCICLEY